jgi:archaellum component FlaD/FlaE
MNAQEQQTSNPRPGASAVSDDAQTAGDEGPTHDPEQGVDSTTPFVWAVPQDRVEHRPRLDRERLYFDLLTTQCPGRPYLDDLPRSSAAELLAFEWLETLRARSDTGAVLRALRYYERLDWVTATVVDALSERLLALDGPTAGDELGLEDHLTSLHYVALLAAA